MKNPTKMSGNLSVFLAFMAFFCLAGAAWATSADDGFNPNADGPIRAIVSNWYNGRILVGGLFSSIGGQSKSNLALLNMDGTAEASFLADTNSMVNALTRQSDHKILVGGLFTAIGGQTRNHIARLNIDGSVDTGFNPDANSNVYSIAVQADGKILVGGDFTTIGGQSRDRIARLNADGSVDTGFISSANNRIYSIAVQGDGKILVGGMFTSINGLGRIGLARLNPDGTVDTAFPGADSTVSCIAIQPDGKILVGGNFTTIGGQTRNQIARLNSNGSVDSGFNPSADAWVDALAIQPDGKILVGGSFTSIGGQARNKIARLNLDGSVDSTFDPGANISVNSFAIQSDGQIVVGGEFTSIGGQTRNHIARLNSDGTVDTTMNPGANSYVYAIAFQLDGKILVGGNFTVIGGESRNRIARLNSNGSVETAFDPGANLAVNTIAIQLDGKILAGGDFTTIGGQSRNRIARLNSDGSVDTGFNPGANSSVQCIALQADGKILVGGGFANIGGQSRSRIARLNSDGSVDTGFNPGADWAVATIAIQPDGKILLGGGFTTVGGLTRNYIARLNSDGSVDTFDPNASKDVTTIAVQPDGKILVGGAFATIGGVTRDSIARLNSDGSADTGFNPGADNAVYSIAIQADRGIMVGGNFTTIAGQSRNRIARLNTDGSIDTGFTSGSGANDSVYAITVQPDGKILVGGAFTSICGLTRNRIARLSADDHAWQVLGVDPSGSAVYWGRDGTSPEIQDVTFEYSADLSTWTPLGSATWAGSFWLLTGQSLPYGVNGYVRGRGKISGGLGDASTSRLESVRLYFNPVDITVTSPNGGEVWTVGESRDITWSWSGPFTSVRIYYSITNGNSWSSITENTANDGLYSWTVPPSPSTTCQVMVCDVDFSGPLDTSDMVFTITGPGETVSQPSTPSGPSLGLKSTSYDFTSGGSSSNLGHDLQYKFDWNDGTDSGWLAVGTTSASHSWTTNGTYNVRAMARCASHTAVESSWSDTHSILISDSGSAGYYNSPASRLIITEVNWAPASGGGNWTSEVQIIDLTGGSTVQAYYNSGTTRNGPFTLWTNSGVDGHNVKFANILQTIDGLDSGPFVYYGTSGTLELITQDATHLIQASVRTYNGNYTRTFPALADCETNTMAQSRTMMISNITNNSSYRPSVVLFNPSADSIDVEVWINGPDGAHLIPDITRTLAGYEMNVITSEVRADTYDNSYIVVNWNNGTGRVMASGQTANNYTNDPAAHLAVQMEGGYANEPAQTKYLTEVNWAPASGGGDWVSEVQITDISGGSIVQVYYNNGTNRQGPFTLWTNSVDAYASAKFTNILSTIDSLDSSAFVYYGTSGALEFTTQDSSHLIQAAVRTYNGNFSRTFPALNDNESNTAAMGRFMIVPNITNNATYRPSVVLFNPTSESVTAELMIVGSDGIPIGSTITRTVAGYEMNVITTEVRANTYDTAFVRVAVTSGSGRLLVSGQTANNYTNDPAAHLAVQGQ